MVTIVIQFGNGQILIENDLHYLSILSVCLCCNHYQSRIFVCNQGLFFQAFPDNYVRLRLHRCKNWVCPGVMPSTVQLYAQRAVWVGYLTTFCILPLHFLFPIHLLTYGGKFWVAQPRHL